MWVLHSLVLRSRTLLLEEQLDSVSGAGILEYTVLSVVAHTSVPTAASRSVGFQPRDRKEVSLIRETARRADVRYVFLSHAGVVLIHADTTYVIPPITPKQESALVKGG